MRYERNSIPQRTELILKFGQGPSNVEITRDAKSVADQSVQVEGVVYVIVGRCQAFDDVYEVGEEYAVAVGKVDLKCVL